MYRSLANYQKKDPISGEIVQYIWEATWDEDGNRIEIETPIKPYLYYEDINSKSTDKSMFGKPLRKMEFNTSWERSKWIETSKNVPLFEKLSPIKQYLLNKYIGMEQSTEFAKYPFRIFNLDIEIEIDNCFPDPQYADFPINVISIYDTLTSKVYVWAYNKKIDDLLLEEHFKEIQEDLKQYDNAEVSILPFNNEHKMLEDFLNFWEYNCPDVITGWNINKFDIMYIINRINKIMRPTDASRLSPVRDKVSKPIYSTFEHDLNAMIYKIQGVNICDYLDLYKKFAGTSRQSFKLDYIANLELGFGKLDYYDLGYESMKEFMEKEFHTFIKYNIIDTTLIKLLNDKLKFIELMRNVCNIGLVEYESIFRSIPYILGALVIQARYNGTFFLTDSNKSDDKKEDSEGFTGAFVYPTKAGYYKSGVVSFDFNSLYPNVMMTVNISPDTKIGKVVSNETDDEVIIRKTNGKLVTITKDQFNELIENKCTISANRVLYVKPSIKQGIIPCFLDKMYQNRVHIKSESKKNLKKAIEIEEAIKKLEIELEKLN
jgi:DNA polymerase elongation subunit (family B)